ncbi:MAG: DUF4339 domain-containing protein [Parachlamydiaceae bacterium]
MSLFITILLWVLCGASASYLANQRGRDPYIWFAIGMLLGLLGVLLLFILPSLAPATQEITTVADAKLDSKVPLLNENDITCSEWFCLDKMRKQQGPLSIGALKELWQKGTIDAQSYVWSEGMSVWKHIQEIALLLQSLQNDSKPQT